MIILSAPVSTNWAITWDDVMMISERLHVKQGDTVLIPMPGGVPSLEAAYIAGV